jgi:hypothetical protein
MFEAPQAPLANGARLARHRITKIDMVGFSPPFKGRGMQLVQRHI